MNPFQKQGAFSWCELMTSDTNAAKEFYQQLFGWTWKEQTMENGQIYTSIKAGEQPVGGILSTDNALSETTPPPHWGVYVTVDNVDRTLELAQSLGAKVFVPPTDIPDTGRFAVFADPQGAVLSIISYS